MDKFLYNVLNKIITESYTCQLCVEATLLHVSISLRFIMCRYFFNAFWQSIVIRHTAVFSNIVVLLIYFWISGLQISFIYFLLTMDFTGMQILREFTWFSSNNVYSFRNGHRCLIRCFSTTYLLKILVIHLQIPWSIQIIWWKELKIVWKKL